MSSVPPASFASLLRQYRQVAGLTQEELAERAHLSREAIGALERGDRRTPHKETIDLLAEALALSGPERAEFVIAARQHKLVAPPQPMPLVPDGARSAPPAPKIGHLPPSDLPPPTQSSHMLHAPRALVAHVKRSPILGGGLVALTVLVSALLLTGAPVVPFAGQHSRTLCIASDFPTTGTQAGLGKPAENAVQLAVMQNSHLGGGYTLKFIPYNDVSVTEVEPDPQRGAQNVTEMVGNPCILGVVGPLNSSVALAEMPITANAGIVMMSPATTNPGLTLRLYAQLQAVDFDKLHPAGKKTNYFQISPNDVIQGIVDADFAFDELGARGVYVIDDHGYYGEGMAGGFTQGFLLRGGAIVGTESIPFGGIEWWPAVGTVNYPWVSRTYSWR
jgi:transcriptional regulator with XRE-family HTH domain